MNEFNTNLADFQLQYLAERGIDQELINCHYINNFSIEDTKQQLKLPISGISFPYFDFNKKVIDYRLRPLPQDWEKNKKYAQKTIDKYGQLPKFLTGKGQGVHPYFSPLLDWQSIAKKTSTPIIITEGETRAILLAKYGIPAIALPGVTCGVRKLEVEIGNDVEIKHELLKELKEIDWKYRKTILCFDSDIIHKKQVQMALSKLACLLTELEPKIDIVLSLLPNEPDGEKNGIDDFIVRHGIDAFNLLINKFSLLQKTDDKLLNYVKNDDGNRYWKLARPEPYSTVKAAMICSVLKDQFAFHPILGWHHWNNRYWQMCGEERVFAHILKMRNANYWIKDQDKDIMREFKTFIAGEEDKIWDSDTWLGFQNGYLNTKTNKFVKPFKEAKLTSVLPYNYTKDTNCPIWQNYLNHAFNNDENIIEYVRAWIRWILEPKNKDRKFLIEGTLWLIGKPSYGKGTFLELLQKLVGESYGLIDVTNLQNNNKFLQILNKKVALQFDVSGKIDDLTKFNEICTNEPVIVWKKHKDEFTARLGAVPILGMNEPLSYRQSDAGGLTRRLHVLNFNVPPKQIDLYLIDKLAKEVSNIFAWAWEMPLDKCITVIKDFKEEQSKRKIDEILENNNPLYQFLLTNYPNGGEIQAKTLLENYNTWAKENRYFELNRSKFSQLIAQLNIDKDRKNSAIFYKIPNLESISLATLLKGDLVLAEQTSLNLFNSDEEKSVESVESVETQKSFSALQGKGCVNSVEKNEKVFAEKNEMINEKKEFSEKVSTPSTLNSQNPCLARDTDGVEPHVETEQEKVSTLSTPKEKPKKLIDTGEEENLAVYHIGEKVKYLPFGEGASLREGFIQVIDGDFFTIKDCESGKKEYCALHQIEKMPFVKSECESIIEQEGNKVFKNLLGEWEPIENYTKAGAGLNNGNNGFYSAETSNFDVIEAIKELPYHKKTKTYLCPKCNHQNNHGKYSLLLIGKGNGGYYCYNNCDTKEIYRLLRTNKNS